MVDRIDMGISLAGDLSDEQQGQTVRRGPEVSRSSHAGFASPDLPEAVGSYWAGGDEAWLIKRKFAVQQKLDVSRIEKHLLARAKTTSKITTAIVHPWSHDALLGAIEAAREGLIEPVLVGPRAKIQAIAKEQG